MAFRAEREKGFHDTDKAVGIGGRTALEGYGRTVFQRAFLSQPVTTVDTNTVGKGHATIGAGMCKGFLCEKCCTIVALTLEPFPSPRANALPSQGTTSSEPAVRCMDTSSSRSPKAGVW